MKKRKNLSGMLLCMTGIFLYIAGLQIFAIPHKIAPGGASGIGILVNYLTGFPIGLFSFLFNIPLLFLINRMKLYDKNFFWNTVVCILAMSFMMDTLEGQLPVYRGDSLLAALFAGAFMGIGMALVHLGYANTGGISLMGIIAQSWKPQFQVGGMIAGLNMIIVFVSGIVFGKVDSILYAVVAVYISGIFMDRLLNTAAEKKLLFVMSDCTDRVRSALVDEQAGITIVSGEGGYSGRIQRIIIGAVSARESARIQRKIEKTDPDALIIVAEVSKVMGKKFGHVI